MHYLSESSPKKLLQIKYYLHFRHARKNPDGQPENRSHVQAPRFVETVNGHDKTKIAWTLSCK